MKVILLTAIEYLRNEDILSSEEEPCPKETKLDVTTVEAKEAWTERDHCVECRWTGVLTILGKKHIVRIVI